MNTRQLTLWDNVALENGSRSLSALKFEEALGYFKNALETGTGDSESIRQLIEACRYWVNQLSEFHKQESNSTGVTDLLAVFTGYDFPSGIYGLKRSLMAFITLEMQKIPDPDEKDIIILFDLWLESGDFGRAEELISPYIESHPSNNHFLYMLAQAWWKQRKYGEAAGCYARALLSCPVCFPEKRIESGRMMELIRECGPYDASSFGWIRGIFPMVSRTADIKPVDDKHRRALHCYSLLREAHQTMLNNVMSSCINYRKELKTVNPVLYDEYFSLLKQRKMKI